jgi:hypothetical protein
VAAFQVDLGERSKRACFTMARILAEELSHFVIDDGARRIVVDTCVGISKDRPQIPEFDTSIDRSRRPCCSGLRPPTPSTPSSAHTCTSIMSAGTPCPINLGMHSFPNGRVVLRVSRHVTRQKPLDTKSSQRPRDPPQPELAERAAAG